MAKYSDQLTHAIRLCACSNFYDLEKNKPYDRNEGVTPWKNPRFMFMREWLLRQLGCSIVNARNLKIPLTYSTGTMVIQGLSFRVESSDVVDVFGERILHRKISKHRVFIYCPECGKYVPVGRLHQHAKVHKQPEETCTH